LRQINTVGEFMFYSELKAKLLEGMTTSVMNYGFDFQVDVVDGDGEGGGEDERLTFRIDRMKYDLEDKEYQFEKHEMLPWEIKNAIAAKERRENVLLWLKAAGAKNLQAVNNNSLPDIPDWQKVKFRT
jgi:hypothetical protein